MRTICGASIALIIAGVGTTAAAETTVSVLGIQALDAPTDVATRLASALKRRVARTPGLQLIKGKNLDEIKLVFGCVNEEPACMARVGRNLQAAKLLWGTLRASGGGYMLSLRYLDVASEKIERSIEQPLTKADAPRAAETAEQLTTALFPAAQGAVRVSSNVVGAEIFVSDLPRGRTTEQGFLVQGVPPGDHVVTVRKKGYGMWKGEVRVQAGGTAEADAHLEPLAGVIPPPPPPRPVPPRRPHRPQADPRSGWKVAFWSAAAVTVGLGVGLAVTGISVLDLEDDKKTEIYRLLNEPVVTLSPEVEEAITVGDACSTGNKASNALRDICEAGDVREDIVNGLVAGTAVAGAVAAFFLYKAYIQQGSAAPADREETEQPDEEARSPWRLITGVSPQGGHVGLSISF